MPKSPPRLSVDERSWKRRWSGGGKSKKNLSQKRKMIALRKNSQRALFGNQNERGMVFYDMAKTKMHLWKAYLRMKACLTNPQMMIYHKPKLKVKSKLPCSASLLLGKSREGNTLHNLMLMTMMI